MIAYAQFYQRVRNLSDNHNDTSCCATFFCCSFFFQRSSDTNLAVRLRHWANKINSNTKVQVWDRYFQLMLLIGAARNIALDSDFQNGLDNILNEIFSGQKLLTSDNFFNNQQGNIQWIASNLLSRDKVSKVTRNSFLNKTVELDVSSVHKDFFANCGYSRLVKKAQRSSSHIPIHFGGKKGGAMPLVSVNEYDEQQPLLEGYANTPKSYS